MTIYNRWVQLVASLIAMIMIANLQYSWTLFVEPMRTATGWTGLQRGRYAQPMKREYKRLTQPLVREAGALRSASWDEALTLAADGFREVTTRHGAKSFGLFSCSKATNEVNYLAQKFARGVIGSHNVDSCNRT